MTFSIIRNEKTLNINESKVTPELCQIQNTHESGGVGLDGKANVGRVYGLKNKLRLLKGEHRLMNGQEA